MQSNYVWLNGNLVPYAEATLHFLTPGIHYGLGAFEGIRCYQTAHGPAIFRLREHLDRLIGSCKVLGWRELPFDLPQLLDACRRTIQLNGFEECYLRPLVYQAEGGWNLCIDAGKPHVGIAVWEWNGYLGADAAEQGVRANVSSYTRHHPNAAMTKAKIAGNYPNSVLAKTESVRLGFDEAIMLDPQGMVAECTGENLFIVKDGQISTPPEVNILAGITRDSLIQLAHEMGHEVAARPISRDELYLSDEVLVCGTAAEVIALREIDFRVIGSGRTGPITRALQRAYHAATRGMHSRHGGWLTLVHDPLPVTASAPRGPDIRFPPAERARARRSSTTPLSNGRDFALAEAAQDLPEEP
jgi:branched-chain amino acid aminotransferase